MNNYGTWSLPKLKEELKKRRAKVSGRKRELIERLESYDRNQNFGGHDDFGDDFTMDLPSPDLYKDINSETDFVEIKMGAIESYLQLMDKHLDNDAKNLYKEKFLKYLRLATLNNLFFIKSECRAQMKKSITYKVDVSVDSDGCIVESQCECAAGMGPNAHCKHVCCLLFALYNFCDSGEIITEETCTQRLQTFHRSKPYKGSPIKASSLPVAAIKASNVNCDPRPETYRQTSRYQDYFRNIWLNHRNVSNFPISQLYAPANLYGVYHDHDYMELNPEDTWLMKNKISKISQEEIIEVEQSTKGQNRNPIWSLERCKRLQSSMFGRICKATDRTDFEKLATSLTVTSNIKTAATMHGQKYESVAVGKYETNFGCVVQTCGIFVSETYPYIAASPDGITHNNTLVEVKCPYVAKDKDISPQNIPFLQLNDGVLTLNKTHNYYYQVQGQMFCADSSKCDFIVYTFKDIQYIRINRDDSFIVEMISKLEQFYKSYFRKAVLQKFLYKDLKKYNFE